MPNREAPGIALMPGETTALDVSFSPHLVLQHLRTRVLLTNRRIIVQSPHTLFGFIPMGYACGSAPLDAVNQINHGHMMRSNRVIGATLAGIVGVWMLAMGTVTGGASVGGALMSFVAAGFMFATARVTGIFFDTGGNHLLAASGRGRDSVLIEDSAQRVIAAIQNAHENK